MDPVRPDRSCVGIALAVLQAPNKNRYVARFQNFRSVSRILKIIIIIIIIHVYTWKRQAIKRVKPGSQ